MVSTVKSHLPNQTKDFKKIRVLHPGVSHLKEQQANYAKIEENIAFWRACLMKVAVAFEAKEEFCMSNEQLYLRFKLDQRIGIDLSDSEAQIEQTVHFTRMTIYSLRFFGWLLRVS